MELWNKKDNFFLTILGVLLLGFSFISFLPFSCSYLAWIALVPWFLLLRNNTLKKSLIFGFIMALFFFGIVTYWLMWVTVPGYFSTIFIYAFYLSIFNLIGVKSYQKFPIWGGIVLPFAYLSIQYFRSTFFFIRFPWYVLGYSQIDHNWIIQTADIWGMLGVTFVIVWVNLAIGEWIFYGLNTKKISPKPAIVCTILGGSLLLFSAIYGHLRLSSLKTRPTLTISVIQGNIPQEMKSSGLSMSQIQKEYMDLSQKSLQGSPFQMGLWPETMLTPSPQNVGQLRRWILQHKQPMLIGAPRFWKDKEGSHYTNSVFYFDQQGNVPTDKRGAVILDPKGKKARTGIYDKIALVPLSEYVPFKKSAPFIYKFFRSFIPPSFVSMDSGPSVMVFTLNGEKFAPSVCFEISFPDLNRKAVQKGASILINLSNDAWFKKTAELDNALILGRARAIETRRGVVRAVNAGISTFIDPSGQHQDLENKKGERKEISGVLTKQVLTTDEQTLYVLWGDWIAILCLFISFGWICVLSKDIFKKKEKQ